VRTTTTRLLASAALLTAALPAAGCGSNDDGTAGTTGTSSTGTNGVRVLALGDSETTAAGDPTGAGWVERYASLLRTKHGLQVEVTNLAENGKASAQVLADVRTDTTTTDAIRNAHVVLLGVGGADYAAGDDAFAAGKCRAEACYAPVLKSFARNYDATVAGIRELGGPDLVIISKTQPNPLTGAEDVIPPFLKPIATRVGVYQAKTANQAICAAMARYDGRCTDLLAAFNGPDGTRNAYRTGLLNREDCCYPSAKGHQLIAQLVLDTGLPPEIG
jgi:lysophospholipase L1-like esterase